MSRGNIIKTSSFLCAAMMATDLVPLQQ